MKYGIARHLYSAFLVVTLVAIGTFSLILSIGSDQEFDRYESRTSQLDLTRMEHWLVGYYVAASGWTGIQPFIDEMQVLYARHIIVTDHVGRIIADSRNDDTGQAFRDEWLRRDLRSFKGETTLGTAYMSPDPTIGTGFRRQLEESLRLLLISAGVVALILALPLSFLLGKPVTQAIEEMAQTARLAGSGDFTARVTHEHGGEFGQLAEALNSMVTDLQKNKIMRQNLVADTAHEIRTPISNIRGYVEAAADRLAEPDIALRAIGEEANRLSHLAEALQDLALSDAGTLKLFLSTQQIEQIINTTAEAARARATALGVAIVVDIPTTLPPVPVDDRRIMQVLHNLLSNAITFSPPGSTVTIAATADTEETSRIGIGPGAPVRVGPSKIRVSVSDSGSGIPDEELDHVFDRFHRIDPSRARTTGGSGLGLTIARGIIQAHGGSIWAEHGSERGTVFMFTLPTTPRKIDPEVG